MRKEGRKVAKNHIENVVATFTCSFVAKILKLICLRFITESVTRKINGIISLQTESWVL